MRLKPLQTGILVLLVLLSISLIAGGISFSKRLQTIRSNLPISTVSQHRGLSGLIENLKNISAGMHTSLAAPSEENFSELNIQIDVGLALSESFFNSLASSQKNSLLSYLQQEIDTILLQTEELLNADAQLNPTQATALLSRLEEAANALQSFYLLANQIAFDSLSQQSERIDKLALSMVIASLIMALLILIIATFFLFHIRSARLLATTRERLTMLSSALEQSPVSVMITGPDGRIEYVNPHFSKVSGYSESEALSPAVKMISLGQQCSDFIVTMHDEIGRERFWRGELENRRKNGESYWESVSVSPLLDDSGSLKKYIIVKEDVTIKKEIAEALHQAKLRAEQATSAKTVFLANMSHEIRTPMTAILGFADLLDKRIDGEIEKDYLRAIISGGKTLLQIINDILDISKIEAGKFDLHYDAFSPRTLLKEIHSLFTIACAGKGIELRLETTDELPAQLYCDEIRLRQILFNLVGNAVKFTDKGKIVVRAATEPCADSEQHVTLQLQVSDNGIGISASQQERIFSAFEQQEGQDPATYGGTGLGLTISRKLTALMHGEISVTSELGKGSCFTLSIPDLELGCQGDAVHEGTAQTEYSFKWEGGTILIADDIADNRKLISEYLKETGLTAVTAKNGAEALAVLERQPIDLIFLDLRMPVMGGIEALSKIRSNPDWGDLPVIVLTASALREQMEEIMQHDFNDYLRKPIDRSTLLATIALHVPCSAIEECALQEQMIEPEVENILAPATALEKLNELLPNWETIKDRGDFSLIEEFNARLEEIAAVHNSHSLTSYCKYLAQNLASFDVEAVLNTMGNFPAQIEQIRTFTEESNS